MAAIRAQLAVLPASVAIGQPISHRLDHLLSGVRAQIALKIYGDDLDTLRGQAENVRGRLASVPGLVDITVERQVLIPQVNVCLDYRKAAQHGIPAGEALKALQTLSDGTRITQVIEGVRRYDLVVRLPDVGRTPQDLARVMLDSPRGPVPLSAIASVEDGDGPNQIGENSRRRIVVYANTDGADMARVIGDVRAAVAQAGLPGGYFVNIDGQFQAQEQATQLIVLLSMVSLALIYLVLYSRYRSAMLTLIIMANIPFALCMRGRLSSIQLKLSRRACLTAHQARAPAIGPPGKKDGDGQDCGYGAALCARALPVAWVSLIRTAATTPDSKVSAATSQIPVGTPNISAVIPAKRAPTA